MGSLTSSLYFVGGCDADGMITETRNFSMLKADNDEMEALIGHPE